MATLEQKQQRAAQLNPLLQQQASLETLRPAGRTQILFVLIGRAGDGKLGHDRGLPSMRPRPGAGAGAETYSKPSLLALAITER